MKKKIIIPLLISLCMLTAAACGNNTDEDSESLSAGSEASEVIITEDHTEAEGTESVITDSEGEATEAVSTEAETASTEEETESTEAETEEIPALEDITVDSEEDGVLLLKALYGTEDKETSDAYVFIYLNTVTVDDVEYYAYTWSQNLGDSYSRLTDVFITLDGSAVYEGDYDVEGCVFNTDNKLES